MRIVASTCGILLCSGLWLAGLSQSASAESSSTFNLFHAPGHSVIDFQNSGTFHMKESSVTFLERPHASSSFKVVPMPPENADSPGGSEGDDAAGGGGGSGGVDENAGGRRGHGTNTQGGGTMRGAAPEDLLDPFSGDPIVEKEEKELVEEDQVPVKIIQKPVQQPETVSVIVASEKESQPYVADDISFREITTKSDGAVFPSLTLGSTNQGERERQFAIVDPVSIVNACECDTAMHAAALTSSRSWFPWILVLIITLLTAYVVHMHKEQHLVKKQLAKVLTHKKQAKKRVPKKK